jgi:glycosyltransferase involved in cell wall biosynthesis
MTALETTGISVVVPVYNSEQSLQGLVTRLGAVLPNCAEEYELVLVNDGSRDNSWQTISLLVQQYHWVKGLNLMRNYGQHNALLCGIRSARFPLIVTMDDDLQHRPEEIPALLAELAKGYDVVYGIPHTLRHSFLRNMASQVTKVILQGAMGAAIATKINSFRAFRAPLREAFANYRGSFVSIDVLLTWGSTRFSAVKVAHESRQFGETNYGIRKLIIHTLNMMTGFSTWPLQMASMLGFVIVLFGISAFIFVIGRYLIQGGVVPGFAFLASTIIIFSGVQLFMLGVFGEYLARIHFRSMDKPTYVVRETLTASHADSGK